MSARLVVTRNLLATNADHAAQIDWLYALDADVVLLQEYTPAWANALSSALLELPCRSSVPIDSPFGTALYSRHPILSDDVLVFDHERMPSLLVALDVDGTVVSVLGTHPPPPVGSGLREARRGQGLLATWSPFPNVAIPFVSSALSLPIDHVLSRGHIGVANAFVGPATGSDHRGLVVDLLVGAH